jgi:hypothetical protein
MGLKVKGLDDADGFKAVHSARIVVKGLRVDVEKRRKELKADALSWGKKVDSEAKRIFSKIEPIETHLTNEEEKITKEKERIAAEKAKREECRVNLIRERIEFIRSVPNKITLSTRADEIRRIIESFIGTIKEEIYQEFTATAKAAYAESVAKIEAALSARVQFEAEEVERQAESARLAKERAELERQRAEENAKLKADRDALEVERRKVEDARREQEHREVVAKAEKEAAKDVREMAEVEAKAKAEAERIARLRPDREKVLDYANALSAVPVPACASEEAVAIISEAAEMVDDITKHLIACAL